MNSTHAFCLLPSIWQITPSSIHNSSYHIKAESNDSSSFSNLCCIGVLLSDKVLAGLYNTSNTNSLYIALHLALKHLQKKNHGCTGFKPLTSVIPVQRSTN